jgi:hypothetical protein
MSAIMRLLSVITNDVIFYLLILNSVRGGVVGVD